MKIRSKKEFFALWQAGVLGNRTHLWPGTIEGLTAAVNHTLGSPIKNIGFRELGKTGGGAWELAHYTEAPRVFGLWQKAGRNFIMDGSVPNDKTVLQGEVTKTHEGLVGFLCERQAIVDNYLWAFRYNTYAEAMVGMEIACGVSAKSGLPPMRQTMAKNLHHQYGYLETRMLLARYLDPSSRDDLDMLLEKYPDAAVEFSTFSINVGVMPHRNTIFWEVRDY